jgi:hypothetical protein
VLPEVARLPLHAPDAVHELALVDDQVSVALLPTSTVVGFAESVTVGAGWLTTVTVALRLVEPPEFEHERLYVEVEESAPVDVLPEVARLPLHAPEAVHDVAPDDDHVRVDALPAFTDVGFAERLTVGGDGGGVVGFTVTVTDLAVEPPLFEQVSV